MGWSLTQIPRVCPIELTGLLSCQRYKYHVACNKEDDRHQQGSCENQRQIPNQRIRGKEEKPGALHRIGFQFKRIYTPVIGNAP